MPSLQERSPSVSPTPARPARRSPAPSRPDLFRTHRPPLASDARHYRTRSLRPGRVAAALALVCAAAVALVLSGCDAAGAEGTPAGPVPLPVATADQQALVTEAFEDVESLFALGFDDSAARSHTALAFDRSDSARHHTPFLFESGDTRVNTPFRFERGASRAAEPHLASARVALATVRSAALARVDTTTYTGVYDAANTKGYLVQLQYRQPQGVGVWSARVQHGRLVAGPAARQLDAVETVALTFLEYDALETFVTALTAGTIPYLAGTSQDAEASFAAYDTWRVAQVYSPAEGEAVVSYANAQLRESLAVRDPVATRNANGTGTVRDGGPDGSVRTRFYGADFAVSATGVVSGTLLRTLYSAGDAADGSVISRTDFPDSSFRQTRQRGGNGVVIRENTQG